MIRFKLYWKHISACAFAIIQFVACTTTGYEKDVFITFSRPETYVPATKIPLRNMKQETRGHAELFKHYCSKGKQTRRLQASFEAVVPSPPSGVTIDEAAVTEREALDKLRETAKSYFLIGVVSGWKGLAGKQFMVAPSRSYNEFAAFKSNRREDYIDYFKSESDYTTPVFIAFEQSEKPILLGLHALDRYTFESLNETSSSSDRVIVKANSSIGEFIGIPSNSAFEVNWLRNNSGRRDRISDTQIIYPVRIALPLESSMFSANYTLLIPKETQWSIWPELKKKRETFFVKEDGTYDLSQAVRKHNELWKAYLWTFTSVKEAQTKDQQIIKFDVSLDLNPFCKYGRPLSDLVVGKRLEKQNVESP